MRYNFGDIIEVNYSNEEKYKAVVFKNKIGYEDGKQDLLDTILEQESSDICTIILLNNNLSQPFYEDGLFTNKYGDKFESINGKIVQTTHGF